MINLKRIIHIKERDHALYCQHQCALCKTPCEKKGRYPTLADIKPPATNTKPKPTTGDA